MVRELHEAAYLESPLVTCATDTMRLNARRELRLCVLFHSRGVRNLGLDEPTSAHEFSNALCY
jgi:hypothetical protein